VSDITAGTADPSPPPGTESVGAPMPLRRATVWMAAGTGISRLTGVLRVVALVYALGYTPLADAYNLANTTPNMLYDIVLGGVLSATFIPVFVERLTTRPEREAWRAISAVISLSLVVLAATTVVFFAAAPLVIDAFTAFVHTKGPAQAAVLGNERAVATSLLRWFVPQVAFYGLIALSTALLNTRRHFVAPMWVPILNNIVCIGILFEFAAIAPHPSLLGVQLDHSQLVLLGAGTTLGVAAQAVGLFPSLWRADLRWRWRWDPHHEAVHTIVRLGAWTFGFVIANQIALYVVLALAVGAKGPAPVSSYQYAYTFMQMPYAVVTVSVMSAVTPDLAAKWTTRDLTGFTARMAGGLRAILAMIIPAAVGMLLLAKPAIALLPTHAASNPVARSANAGEALTMFSLGLPGFCTFLYVVRVLQAMQRARVAFWLYLVENVINVVLALVLVGPLGVRGLALSVSIAYSVVAVAGLVVLHSWLGRFGPAGTWAPLRRVVAASALMGVCVLVVSNLSGSESETGLVVRVGASVVAGLVVYLIAISALGRRAAARRPGRAAGAG
jgi:putative peptidoglycan lipid II flippase